MARLSLHPRSARMLLLAGAWSMIAGCRDEGIATYRIPKEPDAVQPPARMEAAPTGAPSLRWTAPPGWVQQPAGGMRLASFLVSGAGGASANVSVVSFPGTGGDDLANINRWRNQVKLGPVSAAELAGQIQSLDAPAGTFVVADMAGTGPDNHATRILGAWLRQPDRVWFFKMMGSADLVEAQRDAFIAFLKSTTAAGEAVAGQPQSNLFNTNDLPVGQPVQAPVPATPAAAGGGGGMDSSLPVQSEAGESLLWSAPAGWQVQTGNPVRKGSFAVGGGAEVAITAFPGDVGGVLANVNRWRQQAGLEPVDDAGLAQASAPLDSNGLHLVVVDATNGSAPILAALVPWNGGTWFFKLTGPAAAVAKARPDFLSFLRTVRAP